jgi:hypothetical protein
LEKAPEMRPKRSEIFELYPGKARRRLDIACIKWYNIDTIIVIGSVNVTFILKYLADNGLCAWNFAHRGHKPPGGDNDGQKPEYLSI